MTTLEMPEFGILNFAWQHVNIILFKDSPLTSLARDRAVRPVD